MRDDEPTAVYPPLPPPELFDDERVVFAAVLGCAIALSLVIIGLAVLGWKEASAATSRSPDSASIGAALAGGFAGWTARGRRN